ncbi:MAG: DinB family protein [Saprospiraceae bacterium]
MKFNQAELIDDLVARTQDILNRTLPMQELSNAELNARTAPDSWSVLECMEHLNRYGDYYLAEMRKQMDGSNRPATVEFKSNWLGNYFAGVMLPREKPNKMNSPKNMNPHGSQLDKKVVETFIKQQKETLKLLAVAREKNLTKVTTGITLTQWIRIRLGDTFRVVVYHNVRHVLQMERVLKELNIEYQAA